MSIINLFKPNIEKMKTKKNLQGLTKALGHDNKNVRMESAKALGEIANRETVGALIKALKDKDPDVRKQAAWALGKIGDPKATDPLNWALEKGDSRFRLEAVKALRKIKDEKATEALILRLIDNDAKVQAEASKSLEKIGKPAIKALAHALRDEDTQFRYNVAQVLDKLHWRPKDDTDKQYYLIAKRKWNELTRIDASTLRYVILTLQDEEEHDEDDDEDGEESVQTDAYDTLLKLGSQVVEPLIELLNDECVSIKKSAAKVLGELGDARAVKPLESLVYKNNTVEWEILWALAKIKKDSLQHLIQLLGNENEEVRLSAVKALGNLGDDLLASGEHIVKPLVQLLQVTSEVSRARNPARVLLHDTNEKIRAYTIKALCNIGNPATINPVIKLGVDESAADDIYFEYYYCEHVSLKVALEVFKRRSDQLGRFSLAERIVELVNHDTINVLAEAMIDQSAYWKKLGPGVMKIFVRKYSELVGKKFTKKKTYRNQYGALESDEGFFAALEDWQESHGPKVLSSDLIDAIEKGHLDTVKALLDKGADVNGKTKGGYTALMTAAQEGHTEIVQLLLEKGADVEAKLKSGQNALITAAAIGHASIVQVLLEKGADVDSEFGDGETALMVASKEGHDKVVQILLDYGANVNLQRYNGWTALMAAAYRGRANIAKLLLDKGADVNARDEANCTPLIVALVGSNLLAVPVLLKYGADVNAVDEKGNPALVLAAEIGDADTIQSLLAKGANVNEKDEYGNTALLSAIRYSLSNVVKVLLEKGADVNVKNSKGQTPMMIASNLYSSEDKTDIINTLKMYGTKQYGSIES